MGRIASLSPSEMIPDQPRQSKGRVEISRAVRTGPRSVMKTPRKAKLAVGAGKTGKKGGSGPEEGGFGDESAECKNFFEQKVHVCVRFRSTFPFCY
jgi:hypothetical protein